MTSAPLIITPEVTASLEALRQRAPLHPVNVHELMRKIKTAQGDRQHRQQMTEQTVPIPGPWPFFVTFSIETGQPVGTCRHMSMSIMREGRTPTPEAVWLIAEVLGFTGSMKDCKVWIEKLSDGDRAINVVQPIDGWL